MVQVKLQRDALGRISGFICSGHSGYAKRGSDIVCSGISALTLTAVLALEKLTALKLEINQDMPEAQLACRWVNEQTELEKTETIVSVMLIGLAEIQAKYPKFLKIYDMEV